MFLDEPWRPSGEPPCCMACKRPIDCTPTEIHHPSARGTYHPSCARPLLSVIRALEMLGRGFG